MAERIQGVVIGLITAFSMSGVAVIEFAFILFVLGIPIPKSELWTAYGGLGVASYVNVYCRKE